MAGEKLSGKVATVTGGAQGIGRAISLRLAAVGAAVAVADLNDEKAGAVANEIIAAGGKAIPALVDVADATSTAELIERTVRELGRVDVMVANAGVIQVKPFLDLTSDDWDRTF